MSPLEISSANDLDAVTWVRDAVALCLNNARMDAYFTDLGTASQHQLTLVAHPFTMKPSSDCLFQSYHLTWYDALSRTSLQP